MAEHVLALAGGVGGAKLVLGLARLLPPESLTVIVNTGDDDEFHGLQVSPDLDTVIYTLAGIANPVTGWGLADESFDVLASLARLGADTWFNLGDKDLATHIRRTELLHRGSSLSEVAAELCQRLGVNHLVAPMTDALVRTRVDTDRGEMSFQEYFVKNHCEPEVRSVRYEGAQGAVASPALQRALQQATAVIICPSNPFLSIAPILALPGVKERLAANRRPVAIVSPIIAGRAVKGPADRLFEQILGETAGSLAVARYYAGLADHFVVDLEDAATAPQIAALGYSVSVQQTMMRTVDDKVGLAKAVCDFISLA